MNDLSEYKPKAEMKETYKGIFGIFIDGIQIGTIHFGTETDQNTNAIIHINFQPRFWHPQVKYSLKEELYRSGDVYLRFEKEP